MKKHIPNTLTCFNLFFGCLSIIEALQGNLTVAAMWIGASAIVDFFDGLAARALGVFSEMGKQLDSLADVVSFGVAPGMIFYTLAGKCFDPSGFCINMYIPFLIPALSAVRLAKFNLDTRQSDSFIGVPTPTNALFIAAIPFVMQQYPGSVALFESRYFLTLFPFVSAYMLVAELPLLALKFKTFGWKGNEYRYALVSISLLSILILGYAGVQVAILLYILLSVIYNLQHNKKRS